ncbi:SLC13 family permease [Nocardioides sp. YIM 152315]|uniref:SLC13 family permease n=1 Tax=Nocardioides sp. YIM 152315 TaxID=3031760 RepID=UPI0023DBEBD8|nr:SLC13 family permease [Nocardioides sp. YIM 152315]MDF1605379.1 ArsB/NhaD family transporter [Nocardioides sp. YIM 152315]
MPAVDVIPVAALVALLLTAYAHPTGRVEAVVGLAAAAATLATGILAWSDVEDTVRHLGPVVLFLVTILVVADVCGRAGLFRAAAARVRDAGDGRPLPIFTGVFLLAAAVTAVLSLDATVVLLTPVVVAAAVGTGTSYRPGAHACLRMANSASLLLPVSNLTNLLAMPHLDLTFGGFALAMAPVLAVVLVVEYVGLRLLFRRELAETPEPDGVPERPPLPVTPLLVVVLMLAGFGVGSPFGVEPFWVSGAAALVLTWWGRRRGLLVVGDAVNAAHPAFALFVLCLGVVVAAISTGFLGDWVADALPRGTGFGALLAIALIATVLANLLTNLSATLLLLPLLAPLGDTAVLAALLGLNIGSGLSYTGSLANLLWRRGMVRLGHPPPLREFHRVSLAITPISLLSAVATLWLVR